MSTNYQLEYLVSENKLEEAFSLLMELVWSESTYLGNELRNEIIVLRGRYSRLKDDKRKKLINETFYLQLWSEIVASLLEIKDEIRT